MSNGKESNIYSVMEMLIQRMGPAFIVMVTIGVGVYYFFDKFNETSNDRLTQAEARLTEESRLAKEHIEKAQSQLLDTYKSFGPFVNNVIANVKEAVDLQKELSKEAMRARVELDETRKVRDKAISEKEKADLAMETARGELAKKEEELIKLKVGLEEKEVMVNKAKTALEEKEKKLDTQTKLLEQSRNERSNQVANFRAELLMLARTIKGEKFDEATKIAHQVIDRDTTEPLKELANFAVQRTNKAANDMPSFIGRSIDSLKRVAYEDNEFALWLAVTEKYETQISTVIAVKEIIADGYKDLIEFRISENRIKETQLNSRTIYMTRLPSDKNWLIERISILVQGDDGEWDMDSDIELSSDFFGNDWNISGFAKKIAQVEIWKGNDKGRKILDSASFQNLLKGTNAAEKDSDIRIMLALLKSSDSFDAATIPVVGHISQELVETIRFLAKITTSRKKVEAAETFVTSYVEKEDLGRLAAIILHPRFRLMDMSPSEDKVLQQATSVYVGAEYYNPGSRQVEKTWLKFERSEPGQKWLFDGLAIEPILKQKQQSEGQEKK